MQSSCSSARFTVHDAYLSQTPTTNHLQQSQGRTSLLAARGPWRCRAEFSQKPAAPPATCAAASQVAASMCLSCLECTHVQANASLPTRHTCKHVKALPLHPACTWLRRAREGCAVDAQCTGAASDCCSRVPNSNYSHRLHLPWPTCPGFCSELVGTLSPLRRARWCCVVAP